MNWLHGYEDSRPVRIGNLLSLSLSSTFYGEVADALLHGYLGGIPVNDTALRLQETLTDHLVTIWGQADHGIWEVRSETTELHLLKRSWPGSRSPLPLKSRRTSVCGEIWPVSATFGIRFIATFCDNCFDRELGGFTQNPGSKELGASLLLMPLAGFLPVSDSRVQGTVANIERHLMINGLVVRYRTEIVEDGLPAGEGVFLACSFWPVSAL